MTLNNENNNDCCKCTTPEYEIILGAQGPQGRQGEKGEPGFTPIISVKDNTDSNYTLNILTQDGQITTPNLKANLPVGGATGQVLTKNSANQDDCSWQNLPNATEEVEGIARLATETDFTTTEDSAVSETSIVTPALFNSELKAQVNTFIVAGDNITTSVDGEGKVTINAEAEAYSLPQANATTLGGIKANPKTDDDTQPVNIDTTTGLLYTKAGGSVPSNMVTTNTEQTITGEKTITSMNIVGIRGTTRFIDTQDIANQKVIAIGDLSGKYNYTRICSQGEVEIVNRTGTRWAKALDTVNFATRVLAGEGISITSTKDSNNIKIYTISSTGGSTPANVVTSDTNTNLKIWTGTEEEYTAIGTKDPNTIYAIKEV